MKRVFRTLKKYKITLVLTVFIFISFYILIFLEEPIFKSNGFVNYQDKQGLKIKQINKFKKNPVDWFFKDTKGRKIHLPSYRGKKSITINLWATWCAPCIEELPALFQMAKKTKLHNIVLAISSEPVEKINRFLKNSFPELNINSQLIIISIPKEDQEKYLFDTALPVTYLFNKEGYFDQKVIGAKEWESSFWIQYIKNL